MVFGQMIVVPRKLQLLKKNDTVLLCIDVHDASAHVQRINTISLQIYRLGLLTIDRFCQSQIRVFASGHEFMAFIPAGKSNTAASRHIPRLL
jgi:hypothetical protein